MIKSTTLRVEWSEALDKRDEEGVCRYCRRPNGLVVDDVRIRLECAHIVGRKHDPEIVGPRGGLKRFVPREATIPLCNDCHRLFDQRRIDIIPVTTWPEQAYAVSKLGLERAYKRLGGPNG